MSVALTFEPGQQVSIANMVEDSFGNCISSIWVYPSGSARSQDQVSEKTVTRDQDGKYQIHDADNVSTATAFNMYPSITVKDPAQTIISQAQNWQTWYSHDFTLPDPGVTGSHTATLSLDTGPHMGVITATDTFDVQARP